MNTALYILCYILISVILAVLGVLVPIWTRSWYKARKKKEQDDILYREAIKDLLRGNMLYMYAVAKENGRTEQYDLECFLRMYNTYHKLGGNSFINEVKEKYVRFKVHTETTDVKVSKRGR